MRLRPGESVERNVINASKKEKNPLHLLRPWHKGRKRGCQTIKVRRIPRDGEGKDERERRREERKTSGRGWKRVEDERAGGAASFRMWRRNDELSLSIIKCEKETEFVKRWRDDTQSRVTIK